MYYHITDKKSLPILNEISEKLYEEQYKELAQENFFLTQTGIINLYKIDDDRKLITTMLSTVNYHMKWSDFINLLKEYPKDNEFIFIKSIERINNKRIRIIEDLIDEEIKDKFYKFRFVKSEICPILHSPYFKKSKET